MPAEVVFSTFPSADKAAEIARVLVGEQLAACVNLLPVRSIYSWQGEMNDDQEVLAVIKTVRRDELIARLVALHPYELPEAIVLPVAGGYAPYLAWLAGSR